jgi:hypothetical protein
MVNEAADGEMVFPAFNDKMRMQTIKIVLHVFIECPGFAW